MAPQMIDGRGIRNVLTSRARNSCSRSRSTATNTTSGGSQLAERRRTAARLTAGTASREPLGADSLGLLERSIHCLVAHRRGAVLASERLANLRDQLEVALLLPRLDVPGLGQVDVD